MTELQRKNNLTVPTGCVDVVLDTDAYNEIDDQFAIAYLLRSKEKLTTKAIYAAPFHNSNSSGPLDGMERSYNEILKILDLMGETCEVFRGSGEYLKNEETPVPSPAAEDLAHRAAAYSPEHPLYVVAIGAITNVASALLIDPSIAEKIVVVWLGGHALHWQDTKEFNLKQDIPAAQVIFNSGVAFVQIPCSGVCTEFSTTIPELEYYLGGKNDLCDYLVKITKEYNKKNVPAWSKIVWDVTAVAAIVKPETEDMVIIPTPYVTCDGRYAFDGARHHYIYVRRIRRDPLYADLFRKLAEKQ